jgi:hypothetical protein
MVTTKSGNDIATSYTRVVHGGRGDYVEIDSTQILTENLHIPPDQAWRNSDPYWKDLVYYDWYATDDDVKVYFQKKLVSYADYKIGMYYVAPADVTY